MFISLNLINFKCFKRLEKPILFSQVNILTGSNGRGKSTIFQALLLLAQSYKAGKDFQSLKLNDKFLKLGSFRDIVNGGDIEKEIRIILSTDNTKYNCLDFACQGKNDSIEALIDNIYVDKVPMVADASSFVTDASLADTNNNSVFTRPIYTPTSTYESFSQLVNVFFISADRRGPVNDVKMFEGAVGDQIGVHGEKVLNSLYERKEDFQNQVASHLSTIMGGASIHVNSTDFENIRMWIDSRDESNGFKPINVGFGYSYILPLIILPLIIPEGSKLFIENPEAHLHPGGQSRLMNFLVNKAKERKLQLFIETHSEHVINAVRKESVDTKSQLSNNDVSIYFLEQGKEQPSITSIKIDERGNLSDFPVDFFDQERQDLLDIMRFVHRR